MKLYLYGRYFIYTDEPLFASHNIAHGASIAVGICYLDSDYLKGCHIKHILFGGLAIGHTLLGCIYAIESDSLGLIVVEDVYGVAVYDFDDFALEGSGERRRCEAKAYEKCNKPN